MRGALHARPHHSRFHPFRRLATVEEGGGAKIHTDVHRCLAFNAQWGGRLDRVDAP
jgi:hypothetical protein